MIQRYHKNDRRILSLPAVHPCEAVSPVTLLQSLISLSRTITSYHSQSFPTQKRNARESLRQVRNLLIFFEEIVDRGVPLPASSVLSLSELHLAFQKINFLLEDCIRPGSRVWILMKSHFVSSQFLTLIRTFATALDVLPLHSIAVSSEVKELVEMVCKQTRKAKLELDPDDDASMRRVILILNQLENGLETDTDLVKRVLDYLSIKTWGDCHREITFLEEEAGTSDADRERESPLVASLVGFMSYCRGVVFEDSNFRNFDQTYGRCNVETLTCLNPEDFRCPISLELMTDPVTVSTGQTYDRASIQKWLKSGNLTCPKTGERLTSPDLVPNTILCKLIHRFCVDRDISLAKSRKTNRDISRTILPPSPAAASAVKFLAEFLSNRLRHGTNEQKNKAAYEIRFLAKSNIFNRTCLIEYGAVPSLLRLLASTESSIQENAIAALLKLSKHAAGKKEIVAAGGLSVIVSVLREGLKPEAKQMAAATIFYLSSVNEYRKLIGETKGAIPALVELTKEGTTCGKKNGVVAIFGLLLNRRNHGRVVAAGTVPVLINLLTSSSDRTAEFATDLLAVLAAIADSHEGSTAILRNPSGLRLILSTLIKPSTSLTGKEHCVSILHSMSVNNNNNEEEEEVVAAMAAEPCLTRCLYSIIAVDGNPTSGRKARALVTMLHRFHEIRYSRLIADRVPQDPCVPVR